MKVPLNQLLVILGPVADGIVYFKYTGVSGQQEGHLPRVQLGPERPPVHPLSEVDLFCDDAGRLVLSKVLG